MAAGSPSLAITGSWMLTGAGRCPSSADSWGSWGRSDEPVLHGPQRAVSAAVPITECPRCPEQGWTQAGVQNVTRNGWKQRSLDLSQPPASTMPRVASPPARPLHWPPGSLTVCGIWAYRTSCGLSLHALCPDLLFPKGQGLRCWADLDM